MTVQEMIEKKKEYGYSNKMISELSGVPLGTVQKIFSGETDSPRYQTVQALSKIFPKRTSYSQRFTEEDINMFAEKSTYLPNSSASRLPINRGVAKTLDDYMALPEGARIEMIDGTFYDMGCPSNVHQRIAVIISSLFENYIDSNKGKCLTFTSPSDVQLDCDDKTVVQPDVYVVCDRDKINKDRTVGAPDLIIEILSPNNWHMDMIRKKNKYEKAGVKEYWIINPVEKEIYVYNFKKSSDFTTYTFNDEIPVSIWNGKCKVDFKKIYNKISFLYEE